MSARPARLQAAIFDLDGTLVDSEPIYARSDEAFLRRHGLVFESGLGEFLGIGTRDFLLALERRFPDNPLCALPLEERIRLKDESYLELAEGRLQVFPGAVETARALARRGLLLGLASGSSPLVVERVLNETGLRSLFAAVVSAAEVERGKPEPLIFLETARRMGVDPRRCIVFEDSGPGILAAVRADMIPVALPASDSAETGAFDGCRFLIEGGAAALDPARFVAALENSGLIPRPARTSGPLVTK